MNIPPKLISDLKVFLSKCDWADRNSQGDTYYSIADQARGLLTRLNIVEKLQKKKKK